MLPAASFAGADFVMLFRQRQPLAPSDRWLSSDFLFAAIFAFQLLPAAALLRQLPLLMPYAAFRFSPYATLSATAACRRCFRCLPLLALLIAVFAIACCYAAADSFSSLLPIVVGCCRILLIAMPCCCHAIDAAVACCLSL